MIVLAQPSFVAEGANDMTSPQYWRAQFPRPIHLQDGTTLRTLLDGYHEMRSHLHPNGQSLFVLSTIDYLTRAAQSGTAGDVRTAASLLERFSAQARERAPMRAGQA
jgi:hypothetical protein